MRTSSKQQRAVAIRDGRLAAQRLTALAGKGTGSTTSAKSISGTSSNMKYSARRTSLSTVLEQDFTVAGKKSALSCPFAPPADNMAPQLADGLETLGSNQALNTENQNTLEDRTPHRSADPICAAMYAETLSSQPQSATGSAAKCPIRYLDQHSPEDIARYFETHKHEIPRSHEVCVKRYQRNEDDIRKLDAKYGNLVSMIQGLGQKHIPLLPEKGEEEASEIERTSKERVENWAKAVSTDGIEAPEAAVDAPDEDDRDSRFDRPMKEVRVGESPSRPWGISVPIFDPPEWQRPESPPPAPVSIDHSPKPGGCPFGHGQSGGAEQLVVPDTQERPAGKCPFPHAMREEAPPAPTPQPQPQPAAHVEPTFIQQPLEAPKSSSVPQMIFTGPVFIGYPMDQALAFMQQYRGTQ